MMNVYEECSIALGQVQAESAANQPAGSPPNGGTVTYGQQANIPAFIGVFEERQILEIGGFIPHLMATIQVSKSILPANTIFATGQPITVTPPLSATRNCKIISWTDKFSFWQIEVESISQNG
jgi:hypothetical protein